MMDKSIYVSLGMGLDHIFTPMCGLDAAHCLALIDAVQLRVAQSEGFYGFTGDHGMSHQDFQLYDGGGLGNRFRAATGLNPADPKNWREADRFALETAAKESWSAFHGAARVGIGNWQGIGRMQHAKTQLPHHSDKPIHVHTPIHLDGKIIAKVVAKHQVAAAKMPLGVHGGPDDFGSFVGPGSTYQPS